VAEERPNIEHKARSHHILRHQQHMILDGLLVPYHMRVR